MVQHGAFGPAAPKNPSNNTSAGFLFFATHGRSLQPGQSRATMNHGLAVAEAPERFATAGGWRILVSNWDRDRRPMSGRSFRAASEVRVEKIKVLLFAANPRGTGPLDLAREFREIDEEVRLGTFRGAVELILVPGTRPVDLLRKLNENQPQVVHFSSHGNPDAIILESGEHGAEGSGPNVPSIRSACLTGMGGIGKTQLVVEYVYRHREDCPDGIFWIDAAGPLAEGFARLATDHRLRWAENDQPRDEQIQAAFKALDSTPQTLLVLDNLPDPSSLAVSLSTGCVPEDLRCRVLFTTRRHDLGRFVGIEVTILHEEPAFQLLLRHPSRRAVLTPSHADHEHARAIARMLGRLPLALELAGAYLGKYSGDISLESYREGLKSDGVLATLDADAAELSEADLRRVHDPAVAATIGEQWASLRDESARLLLRVASLFSESTAVPIARLGLLAGLSDEARPGRRSPLRRAAQRLDDACLVERVEGDQLRLHPLIREFARSQTPADQIDQFVCECLARVATALEECKTLETLYAGRGVDSLQEDLIAFLELYKVSASNLLTRLQLVLPLMQQEAHNLRGGQAGTSAAYFAQQVRNRAVLLSIAPLRRSAEARLVALAEPHFALQWTASRESRDLIRTLTGHGDWVSAVEVSPDSRHAFSGSGDRMLRLWDLRTGQLLRTFTGHERTVKAVAVSPDGRQVLSGSHDCTLRLWDVETGGLLNTFTGHAGIVFALAMDPNGRRAISGSRDCTLRLWDLQSGPLLRTWVGHEDGVCAVAICPDGRRAFSGSRDRTLKLWDLETGQLLRTLTGHDGMVVAAAVGPDGRHGLSGSDDRTLRLWDLQTGQLLRTFVGHEGGVNTVAMSTNGRHGLSGSDDRTLRLWDQEMRVCRAIVPLEGAPVSVALGSDGQTIVVGDRIGNVHRFHILSLGED
jgi:hypothetical protein